jgi:hypothetical protein
MWIPTFHRFATEADFLAACDAAGWPRDHRDSPAPPDTVALDIIGPYAPAPIEQECVLIPAAIDGRWHVNALWRGDVPAAWQAAEITPSTPGRAFAVPPPPAPVPPAVPPVIAAWKAKRILRGLGLLDDVEAAVAAAGGLAADAWAGAAEWSRDSAVIASLGGLLNLTSAEIDDVFVAADAIRG